MSFYTVQKKYAGEWIDDAKFDHVEKAIDHAKWLNKELFHVRVLREELPEIVWVSGVKDNKHYSQG